MSDLGEQIIQAVRKAAADNPGFIYDEFNCVYVRDGQPACLVGHGLWDLDLIDANLERDQRLNGENIADLLCKFGHFLDQTEVEWLEIAQEQQDTGKSWGNAVRYADGLLREYEEAW